MKSQIIPDDPYLQVKDVKEFIRQILEEMWKHPKRFEGIKSKTCLPLDYVEEIIKRRAGKELIE